VVGVQVGGGMPGLAGLAMWASGLTAGGVPHITPAGSTLAVLVEPAIALALL